MNNFFKMSFRLEIMESMALYQETAYEKLYRWAQGNIKTSVERQRISYCIQVMHLKL